MNTKTKDKKETKNLLARGKESVKNRYEEKKVIEKKPVKKTKDEKDKELEKNKKPKPIYDRKTPEIKNKGYVKNIKRTKEEKEKPKFIKESFNIGDIVETLPMKDTLKGNNCTGKIRLIKENSLVIDVLKSELNKTELNMLNNNVVVSFRNVKSVIEKSTTLKKEENLSI